MRLPSVAGRVGVITAGRTVIRVRARGRCADGGSTGRSCTDCGAAIPGATRDIGPVPDADGTDPADANPAIANAPKAGVEAAEAEPRLLPLLLPAALAEWNARDGSVREVLRKLLKKRLEQPRMPGAELHGNLRDCYKIKLLKQGYRLVYQVEDDVLVVLVLAVAKREDMAVYRAAVDRLLAGN